MHDDALISQYDLRPAPPLLLIESSDEARARPKYW
jgi:hypothetical protein